MGCQQNGAPETPDGKENGTNSLNSNDAGKNGKQILEESLARYSSATSYSDSAVLYLNYTLEGRPIQEPHPFSTAWDANQRWAARIFNSQIQCDGQRLSCYVFDINSANLDNQQLFLPVGGVIPLEILYRDPIVRHFLGGYAELPLDQTEKAQPPKLIPPPISMLTKQLPFAWIQDAGVVERMADANIDDRSCYVVRSLAGDTTADIWIDQQSMLVAQISLPLKLMTREVVTSREISDVEMLLRFHDAAVDQPINDDFDGLFAVNVRPDIKPVQRFVAIPDPLPSERIGQVAPDFTLFRTDGTTVDRLHFDGKTTALLWLGGDASLAEATKFAELAKTLSSNDSASDFNLAAVYSDLELAKPGSSSVTPNTGLQAIIDSTQLPFFYDAKMAASSRLMIKAVPTVVVLDGDSNVQFARALSDDGWADDLVAAVRRIEAGESVAGEMRQKYEEYLNDYHEQLTVVSAAKIAGVRMATNGATSRAGKPNLDSGLKTVPDSGSLKELKSKLEWTKSEFQKPGNIYVDRSGQTPKLLVFDGWRTVVEFDAAGKVIASHELELPDETAVSCLRMVPGAIKLPALSDGEAESGDSKPSIRWAAFHVKGRQVFLFDENWKRVAAVPDIAIEHDGIRDVMFTSDDPDAPADLLVAFDGDKGVFRLNIGNGQAKQISKQSVRGLTRAGDDLFYVTADGFGSLAGKGEPVPASAGLQYRRLSISPPELPSASCLIAAEQNQNWFACGFSPSGKINWQQPIGSMLFENEIEPVAFEKLSAASATSALIAVADAESRINLFSDAGVYLGQVRTTAAVSGVAVLETGGVLKLIVSSGGSLQCWRLE